MAIVFFLTFTIGDFLKGYFEIALDYLTSGASALLQALHVHPMLSSLITDGIISGVGGILTFLPNIFILFLALAFFDDSGYMARVAFVMDDIMSHLGLSGKAFLPLLLGFGCSVPAVMASRALEHPKDRFKTILITPFMSCSARLPIYVLFSSMFFGEHAMLRLLLFVHTWNFDCDHNRLHPFSYRRFKSRSCTVDRASGIQVTKCTHHCNLCMGKDQRLPDKSWNRYFPGICSDVDYFKFRSDRICNRYQSEFRILYWESNRPALSACRSWILADHCRTDCRNCRKRSGCVQLQCPFGIRNITTAQGMTTMSATLGTLGFGPANAYALMVFCLLYVPCTATIATIHRELNSWKSTISILLYQLVTAWTCSCIAYHVCSLLF